MSFLTGKRIFITGVASERSIAWGIAQAMARQGAELAFSYQGDKLHDRVTRLAAKVESDICVPLDVSSDQEIDDAISALRERWDRIDGLVHSIGFAPREQLNGSYIDSVTREGSQIAHDISSYSFAALAKAARPAMTAGSSLLTLSYLGAVRAIPNYNVMGPAKASLEANIRFLAADLGPEGIRVNGISAGPIKTLAASGVKNFRALLSAFERVAPLRRVVTIEEVGNAAAFLCSDLATGITGEIMYVDGGFNITAMVAEHS